MRNNHIQTLAKTVSVIRLLASFIVLEMKTTVKG